MSEYSTLSTSAFSGVQTFTTLANCVARLLDTILYDYMPRPLALCHYAAKISLRSCRILYINVTPYQHIYLNPKHKLTIRSSRTCTIPSSLNSTSSFQTLHAAKPLPESIPLTLKTFSFRTRSFKSLYELITVHWGPFARLI